MYIDIDIDIDIDIYIYIHIHIHIHIYIYVYVYIYIHEALNYAGAYIIPSHDTVETPGWFIRGPSRFACICLGLRV